MSSSTNTEWEFEDNAIVAVFDILGFKRMIKETTDLRNLALQLSLLIEQVQGIASESTSFEYASQTSSAQIQVAHASDTFVIYSAYSCPADLIQFLWNVQQLLFHSIRKSFPLRGAISFGEVAVNRTQHIFLGPTVLDALELEKVANWAGAILGQSAERKLVEIGMLQNLEPLIIEYAPPYKPELADRLPERSWCINWLADWPNQISPDYVGTKFPPVKKSDLEFRSVQEKILNTRNFMEHARLCGHFADPSNRKIVLDRVSGGHRRIRFVLEEPRT